MGQRAAIPGHASMTMWPDTRLHTREAPFFCYPLSRPPRVSASLPLHGRSDSLSLPTSAQRKPQSPSQSLVVTDPRAGDLGLLGLHRHLAAGVVA